MKLSETGQPDNDKVLAKIEKKINKEYTIANKEMEKKLKNYMKKFEAKDKEKKKLVKSGQLSQDDYIKWRQDKIVVGKQWESMCQVLAEDLDNSRIIAQHIVSNDLPTVYANGLNYGTYEIEKTGINTNFTLYNHDAVEILVSENPKLYPDPTQGSETWQKLKSKEVQKWSKAKINSAVTQAILQGEAINEVAKRLRKVTDMDYKASVRNARTMVGAAQNAGHQRSYERAENMGVNLVKVWVSTLDMRTRHTHAVMDGEAVPVKEKFSNGLLYPRDILNGTPAEVYNCRCRPISQVKGFEKTPGSLIEGKQDKLNGMTYDEWKQYHQDVLDGKFKKPAKGSPYELVKGKDSWAVQADLQGTKFYDDFTDEIMLTSWKEGYVLSTDYWTALIDGKAKNKKIEEILQKHYGAKPAEKGAKKATQKVNIYEQFKGKDYYDILDEIEDNADFSAALMKNKKKHGLTSSYDYFEQLKAGTLKDDEIEKWLEKHYGKPTIKETLPDVYKDLQGLKYDDFVIKSDFELFDKFLDLADELQMDDEDLFNALVSGKMKSEKFEKLIAKHPIKGAEKVESIAKPAAKPAYKGTGKWSDERKANAKNFTDKDEADKYHRPLLDDMWDDLEDREKYSLWQYTENSHPINKPLSGYESYWDRSSFVGLDKADWNVENSWRYTTGEFSKFGSNGHVQYGSVITDLTKGIEKSEFKDDVYLFRGSDENGLAGLIEGDLFSFEDAKTIINGTEKELQDAFVGQTFQNHAFTSTGISSDAGFTSENVIYEVYAPKGTKGIYAEPQSHFGASTGQYDRLYEKGDSYPYVGGEAEVVLQRGTTFRITDIEKSGGKIHIKMEVVDQPNYFKYGDEDTFNGGLTRHRR